MDTFGSNRASIGTIAAWATALFCLATAGAAAGGAPAHAKSSPFAASETSARAGNYYLMHWGVDSMVVKSVPSDQLIRFSYRVVDANKAKALSLKEAAPQLYDEKSRVSLVVPTMDKVGQLRQSGPPENGKVYWMVFSNKGNLVKPGHRVGVVIGEFHANGLPVL